jgi:hypothetical protein
MIEHITHQDQCMAIIIRSEFQKEGIEFFTPEDFSQQLAYMKRPAGYTIAPHIHNPVPREVFFTQEVLMIKSGKVRVDFYDQQRAYLESRLLGTGDVILLATSGHGFEMIETSEIIEVKQGPYTGEKDKSRFVPQGHTAIQIKGSRL